MPTLERILEQIKTHFNSDVAFEEAAGLKRKTVDNWKRGLSQSYLKMIPELCEIFDVDSDYLHGTEKKPTPPDGGQPASSELQLRKQEAKRRIENLDDAEALEALIVFLERLENPPRQ